MAYDSRSISQYAPATVMNSEQAGPCVSFDEYLDRYNHTGLTADDVIAIMVGDLQRIRVYPERGFQIPQEIPAEVWAAFEALVAAGYDRY